MGIFYLGLEYHNLCPFYWTPHFLYLLSNKSSNKGGRTLSASTHEPHSGLDQPEGGADIWRTLKPESKP